MRRSFVTHLCVQLIALGVTLSQEFLDESKEQTCSKEANLKQAWAPWFKISETLKNEHGIVVSLNEQELNGSLRFVADNVMNKTECMELLSLSEHAKLGNGYEGDEFPHSGHESIRGLQIADVTKRLRYKPFQLLNHVVQSEIGNLQADNMVDRYDLSHSIHGDNCVFKDGKCDKVEPALTWRDYSAILYLNDDFEGGEFVFSDNLFNIQATILPACGKVVGFSGDNLHGVNAVKKGSRCALAMWMTLVAEHEELDRHFATQFLASIEKILGHEL